MQKSELLIIGTIPETVGIGGVSIHVERLLYWLREKGQLYDFCDYKQESLRKILNLIAKHKIIHIHPSSPIFRLFLVCVSRLLGKKVVFTVHGNLGRFSFFKNIMDKFSVIFSNVPVVINEESYKKAIKWNKSTRLISAYISPYSDGYISSKIIDKIETAKQNNKIIVSTNASVRSFIVEGEEIYGIDFLVKYFSNHLDYFLFISDPTSQYADVYKNVDFENIIFITGNHSFYALMKHSDITVRCTATDGDSLSVREGLDLNIKVLATDRVSRPNGVILFKYNDSVSFEQALLSFFEKENGCKENDNVVNELILVYKNLM